MQAPANTFPAASPAGQVPAAAERGLSTARVDQAARPAGERPLPQLGLAGIVAIWAAAALPMGLLAWVVAPLLADHLGGASALPRALIVTLTAGLVWQSVLVLGLVAHEQGTLRWSVLREALWLRSPRSPRSGRRGGRLWLIVPVLVVAFAATELVPGFDVPGSRDLGEFLESDAGHSLLAGAWGWFAVMAAMFVFNTALGEELLFRGFLLPRMNGVFGRRDWLASATGVLSSASPYTARRASSSLRSCSPWCSKVEPPRPAPPASRDCARKLGVPPRTGRQTGGPLHGVAVGEP